VRVEKKTKEQETHQKQLYKKMLGTAGDEGVASRQEVIVICLSGMSCDTLIHGNLNVHILQIANPRYFCSR